MCERRKRQNYAPSIAFLMSTPKNLDPSLPQSCYPELMEDLRVVFESTNRQSCSDRALVLAAVQIPHQLVDDGMSCASGGASRVLGRAVEELRLYEDENPPATAKAAQTYCLPGRACRASSATFWSSARWPGWPATRSLGVNWFVAGRVDGNVDSRWRVVADDHGTDAALRRAALAGQSGLRRLLRHFRRAPAGFGRRLAGRAVAAALGNTANTLLLDSTHRSIGASTAVFATLGILAGYVWRGQLMAQDRWSTRYRPDHRRPGAADVHGNRR